MQWKFEGSGPVYKQIMAQIRHAIMAGEFPPGSRIPPVRELAAQARVNPNTMQRALMMLEMHKILLACGTVGRYVTSDEKVLEKMRQQELAAVVRSCASQLAAVGLTLQEAGQLLPTLPKEEEEEEIEWKPY